MSATEWVVVVGGALVGFGVVSWILTVIEQQKRPPVAMDTHTALMPVPDPSQSSPAGVSDNWHMILGVSAEATAVQIESAYHARIAECDRVRFDSKASTSDRQSAEARRAEVCNAFEFIRPLKN